MNSVKKTRMSLYLLVLSIVIIIGIAFFNHPMFGKAPSGKRLERIQKNKHYKKNSFQNISPTPALAEGVSYWEIFKDMILTKVEHTRPNDSIPYINTNLAKLDIQEDYFIWFGHSSYFIQADLKSYLIDPVLTKNASPIYGTNVAFKGADVFDVNDLPKIDFLIITHDHYDHLDYTTFKTLQHKVSKVVCPLGVGEHLEYWGYPAKNIIELEWWEEAQLNTTTKIVSTPTRHFSGRGFTRNNTLWTSYVFQSEKLNLYFGGDSGYDFHFKEIGEKYGPFDLAIIENGQYNYKWKYIHLLPEEVIKAVQDLKSSGFIPVHSSKFKLANHPWKEPLEQVAALSHEVKDLRLLTPKIGEIVYLNRNDQSFEFWWDEIK